MQKKKKKNEWHLTEINNVIFCLFFVLSLRAYNFFHFCIPFFVYIIDEEHFLWSYNGKLFCYIQQVMANFYYIFQTINNITLKIMKTFIIYHSRTEEVFSLQNV